MSGALPQMELSYGAYEGRRTPGILGYDDDLHEPIIRVLNDAQHP